ncbi:sugar ABC transporter ATP-binding protein, partial [Methylobacterium tarhaniae]
GEPRRPVGRRLGPGDQSVEHPDRVQEAGRRQAMVLVRPPGGGTKDVSTEVARDIACVFRDRIGAGPGERINITADPGLVHLFDAESGRRLN